jgi:hypothetical protein
MDYKACSADGCILKQSLLIPFRDNTRRSSASSGSYIVLFTISFGWELPCLLLIHITDPFLKWILNTLGIRSLPGRQLSSITYFGSRIAGRAANPTMRPFPVIMSHAWSSALTVPIFFWLRTEFSGFFSLDLNPKPSKLGCWNSATLRRTCVQSLL